MVEKITATDLRDKIDAGEEFVLFDNRPEADYENWHIDGAKSVEYSAADDELIGDLERHREEVEAAEEVVTICAVGKASQAFAEYLEDEEGLEDVTVVEEGMDGWGQVYDVVPIATRSNDLEILQLQRRGKGCLGYVVGCSRTGEAAAIDVTRHNREFLEAARDHGFRITAIFETHIHADHLMVGGRELRDELEVPYYLGSEIETRDPEFEYDPVEPTGTIEVGEVTLKGIHTPGHTTGSTCWLVEDETVMTGDTLFVESVGRTELQFEGADAEDASEILYESLQSLMELPDTVTVLPGHFNVTNDGRYVGVTPGTPMSTTIGYIRRHNEMVRMDKAEYVETAFENIPEKPPNYETVIATNEGKRDLESEDEADELELGPNRCAATEESVLATD
ncbi:MBL fold metallo-hydrolase [Natrialbaceae archaeon AArc-T1-2]|uniref:MBL fold metallo-hydrolase n=1 Tax=Natrialbaceae archaeon AArc-T1-2 TaxID=3053904 RepID=UPI00255A88B4|nr:MBL fold metallo-hydrolase [Natrialbaceae archaeon AArc-T1-2]WIV66883.1 MBL fold metallo-hydrolase [Natrialbaceae archaeon AArc-T1-2]